MDDKAPLLENGKPQTLSQRLKGMMGKGSLIVAIYTICYVASGVINSIYLKKVMNSLNNYPFFLNQVTNYGYIPIFGSVVLYELRFTKLITKEQREFPWYKFFIMGSLDAINGYIVVIGGVGTSGTMQQLLNQAIIPVTMIGSFIFLKERYSLMQIGGSLLIVAGVIVSLLPSLTSSSGTSGNIPFFNMFFLSQAIPFAASNLYKDIAFKSVDMDVWYLQFWDVFYQSVIGTFLFPVNTILPPPANIHWKEMPIDMKNGAICLSGTNIITSNCGGESNPCDACYHAWLVLIIYMCINVVYNVFILLVIKHGSATVLSIAMTVRLPLTSIAFSQNWIMGDQVEPFSNYSLYGLFIILGGLTAFRAGSLIKKAMSGTPGEEGTVTKIMPRLGPIGTEIFSESLRATPLIIPKTTLQHRQLYFSKLGIVQ